MGVYYYTEYEPLGIQAVLGRFYIKMLFRARQRMCSSHMLGFEGLSEGAALVFNEYQELNYLR